MKRFTIIMMLVLVVLFVGTSAFAQLTGTRKVPGDYPTLAAAIADLNSKGVGKGGVTISLAADNPVTVPSGGFIITTSTASETNRIVIEGNGNRIIAPSMKESEVTIKGVFKTPAVSYISIDGFITTEATGAIQETEAPPVSIQPQTINR